jgi:hypothetical protein
MKTNEFEPGFPSFWPDAAKEFKKFFEVGKKLESALISVTDIAYPSLSGNDRIILNLSILAGITMTEIVTLVGNGMGHGAMKLVRTLLETSINTEYLRLCPSEFDDYKEWFWIEKYKELVYIRTNVPDIFKLYPAERAKEVEENRNRVLPRFQMTKWDGSKEVRNSWCSKNLGERAKITGHQDVYQRINRDASGFIHSTMSALMRYHDVEKDMDRIDVPPNVDWTAGALSTAHICLIQVVETASRALNAPCNPTVEELTKDFHYAWDDFK